MLDLETITRNSTARCLKIIEVTPQALRECADRLELALKESFHSGESILCELTPRVHVIYKPEKEVSNFIEMKSE